MTRILVILLISLYFITAHTINPMNFISKTQKSKSSDSEDYHPFVKLKNPSMSLASSLDLFFVTQISPDLKITPFTYYYLLKVFLESAGNGELDERTKIFREFFLECSRRGGLVTTGETIIQQSTENTVLEVVGSKLDNVNSDGSGASGFVKSRVSDFMSGEIFPWGDNIIGDKIRESISAFIYACFENGTVKDSLEGTFVAKFFKSGFEGLEKIDATVERIRS
eukprot:GDKJ01015532.1.p1 GENE.GDKJ01015532.1~~GDKJ01015532.1.p1  ORF type:complete len:224 (-),score=30.87 GDKJ01015532.1:362-1033(-)